MDLTVIKGLGPARREKLESAGVETITQLAEADPATLTEDVGISESMLRDFQGQARDLVRMKELEGVSEKDFEALVEADVTSLEQLAKADLPNLQDATGIGRGRLHKWKEQAGHQIETVVTTGAASTTIQTGASKARERAEAVSQRARKELENARVVLEEGIADAKVKLDRDVVAEVRILPVKAKDNVDQVLDRVRGNVVVLQEKADTALLRFEDSLYEGVPLFKEKVRHAQEQAEQEVQEVRVRVQEIRDKRVLPGAERLKERIRSFFGRGS